MSKSIKMTILLTVLKAMPSVAQDIEKIAAEAESKDDLETKIKDILGDLIDTLEAFIGGK